MTRQAKKIPRAQTQAVPQVQLAHHRAPVCSAKRREKPRSRTFVSTPPRGCLQRPGSQGGDIHVKDMDTCSPMSGNRPLQQIPPEDQLQQQQQPPPRHHAAAPHGHAGAPQFCAQEKLVA